MKKIYVIEKREYNAMGALLKGGLDMYEFGYAFVNKEDALKELKELKEEIDEGSFEDEAELSGDVLYVESPTFETGEMRLHYEYTIIELGVKS